MEQTNAFHYWAVLNVAEFEFIGDKYKISREQVRDFYDLTDELLKNRDAVQAGLNLPPSPLAEIDDAYWLDLERTRDYLRETLDNESGSGSLYYVGTVHLLQ
jgi:hypothetical protein